MVSEFMAPIPGQSLTTEPGNAPWEQPPLYADVESVLKFYIKKINKEDSLDDLLFLLEEGMPLRPMVESMLTMGVMEGYHTIDSSILVGPAIHEYIMDLAETAGIKVVEGGETKEDKERKREKMRLMIKLGKAGPQEAPEEELEMEEDMQPELPFGEEEMLPQEPPAQSEPLVSRRV